jgi:hypothetical protein
VNDWQATLTKQVDGTFCDNKCSRGRSGSRQRARLIASKAKRRSDSSSWGWPALPTVLAAPTGADWLQRRIDRWYQAA